MNGRYAGQIKRRQESSKVIPGGAYLRADDGRETVVGLELQFLFVKKLDRDKQYEPQIDQQPEDELEDPHTD